MKKQVKQLAWMTSGVVMAGAIAGALLIYTNESASATVDTTSWRLAFYDSTGSPCTKSSRSWAYDGGCSRMFIVTGGAGTLDLPALETGMPAACDDAEGLYNKAAVVAGGGKNSGTSYFSTDVEIGSRFSTAGADTTDVSILRNGTQSCCLMRDGNGAFSWTTSGAVAGDCNSTDCPSGGTECYQLRKLGLDAL